jgi:hypothetical protein
MMVFTFLAGFYFGNIYQSANRVPGYYHQLECMLIRNKEISLLTFNNLSLKNRSRVTRFFAHAFT